MTWNSRNPASARPPSTPQIQPREARPSSPAASTSAQEGPAVAISTALTTPPMTVMRSAERRTARLHVVEEPADDARDGGGLLGEQHVAGARDDHELGARD